MTPDQVRATYDEAYARRYDAAFLHTPEYGFREKTQLELFTLRMLTMRADSWLDVACGTGFFLRALLEPMFAEPALPPEREAAKQRRSLP